MKLVETKLNKNDSYQELVVFIDDVHMDAKYYKI